ncbi:hypothetical protein AGMMS4956_07070 [Bacteroidia bacterium]|nr:hypothetical protein AGMMS4956_07070 [Bacteroidia bacterium]
MSKEEAEFIQMQSVQALLGLAEQANDREEASTRYAQFMLWHKRTQMRQAMLRMLRLMQRIHPFAMEKDEKNNRIIISNSATLNS